MLTANIANPIGVTGASSLLRVYHESKNASFSRFIISSIYHHTALEHIDGIPAEICQQSFDEIFDFLKAIKSNGVNVYRSKIQLLGHQSAGKTSIMHSLFPLSGSFMMIQPGSCCSPSSEYPVDVVLTGPLLAVTGLHPDFAPFRMYLSNAAFSCSFPSEQTILLTCTSKTLQKTKSIHLEFTSRGMADYNTSTERVDAVDIKDAVPATIEFAFSGSSDKKTYNDWREAFIHWTIGISSRGVSTKAIQVPMKVRDNDVTADVRVLDFAGQEEFVEIMLFMNLSLFDF